MEWHQLMHPPIPEAFVGGPHVIVKDRLPDGSRGWVVDDSKVAAEFLAIMRSGGLEIAIAAAEEQRNPRVRYESDLRGQWNNAGVKYYDGPNGPETFVERAERLRALLPEGRATGASDAPQGPHESRGATVCPSCPGTGLDMGIPIAWATCPGCGSVRPTATRKSSGDASGDSGHPSSSRSADSKARTGVVRRRRSRRPGGAGAGQPSLFGLDP